MATEPETLHPPLVDDASITFALPDEHRTLAAVKLAQEISRPRIGPEFSWNEEEGEWRLRWLRPDADRMEYMLELTHDDGTVELVCDPCNPLVSPGPFGHKSVLEFPGYEPPKWLEAGDVPEGGLTREHIRSRVLSTRVPVVMWNSPGADPDVPLPLLIAHDGPEYAEHSGLLRVLNVMVSLGRLPAMRAALVSPVIDRNQIYSASAAYSRALAHDLVPALNKIAPTPHGRRWRIGMGASLGALAMLHVHRRSPAIFGGLFLQSGSFFRQRFDKQESGFVRFRRISRFMGQVLTADDWAHPIPVAMTCGSAEENLANNKATRAALERQGYEVHWHENRDAHNWVAWRDTFDPHLVELLARMWT